MAQSEGLLLKATIGLGEKPMHHSEIMVNVGPIVSLV